MPQFSEKDLADMETALLGIQKKYENLLILYMSREYKNVKSAEYAKHGFSRRIKTITRCLYNVFDILPPNDDIVPSSDVISTCTINIHAFMINIYGSIDNLAWILVHERGITKPDGSPIPPTWVGMRKTNKIIRDTLSIGFQKYLDGLECWFYQLENFRDALAHRIPLYIPPHIVDPADIPRYQELDILITDAVMKGNIDRSRDFSDEQKKLMYFKPIATHSFEEGSRKIIFHPQMLADFHTIEELSLKFLAELNE